MSGIHIGQLDLVVAIMNEVDRQHPKITASTRQLQAITDAANVVCDAFRDEDKRSAPGMGISAWLECDDVGASSLYMLKVMRGCVSADPAYPRDPSDFGRCVQMLQAEPSMRDDMQKMASQLDPWPVICEKWEAWESLWQQRKVSELNTEVRSAFFSAGVAAGFVVISCSLPGLPPVGTLYP